MKDKVWYSELKLDGEEKERYEEGKTYFDVICSVVNSLEKNTPFTLKVDFFYPGGEY